MDLRTDIDIEQFYSVKGREGCVFVLVYTLLKKLAAIVRTPKENSIKAR